MRYLLFIFSCLCLIYCANGDKAQPGSTSAPGIYLLTDTDLPDYESHLDHKALMANWTEEFYHKGMVTYRTVCFNCHGNAEQPGSMPNAAKFWKDTFKNGSDPYAMYQTITKGFGLMPPQVRLSPQEKYEVIHFIREEFMKEQNPSQYFEITDDWLDNLPPGDTVGPAPQPYQPWAEMDYGNFLMRTYDLSSTGDPDRGISVGRSPLPNEDFRKVNFAYKGIAIRLDEGKGGVASGNAFVLFDHDLMRFTGFWTGEGFIDYEDILLNDRHNIFPRTVGQVQIENPITPGWANPQKGNFADPRFVAVDGRPFGPLPKEWAHYEGLYYHGDRVVIQYTVGKTRVLETYDLEAAGENPVISRTLNITSPGKDLKMRIAPTKTAVRLLGDGSLTRENGFQVLHLTAGKPAKVKLLMAPSETGIEKLTATTAAPEDLQKYTQGGPAHYTEVLSSPIIRGEDKAAYVEDVFVLPLGNPWKSRMRPTGIDFLEDPDQALVCTIDGEVWRLEGISQPEGMIKWHRIATGLFQPLGIKYHQGKIYVSCRDQIAVLEDLNGDGETDFYRSFNNDHQVTEHFHEFAMGLQVDEAGNFYYAKSGRHARTALTPQHGTLIKVSPDGEHSEIIARGFRAANGVCLNPDGSFIVTDQEGYWNPMNRINWVEEGGFYGNMYGYGAPADTSDAAMIQPLCWIDSKYDRSPAELLWAESEQWGPLNGSLLSLSYGYGKMFAVLPQKVGDIRQAGIVEVPVPQFPTGLMRGRFHPADGQFYGCGMSAWATNQMIQVGGLYRVRYTGLPLHLPVAVAATEAGMELTFSDPLHKASAENPANFEITTWDLKRSHNYGSKRYNVQQLKISSVELDEDGKVLRIALPEIQPTWVMEIKYQLESTEGKPVEGVIQNTIYALGKKTASDI
jgi:cytochrome c5